jgi:predicted DNA binding CopG/RHH family protein
MGKMSEKEKQKLQLDEEEREILEAFEAGKLEPIEMSKEEIEELKEAAKKVLSKRSRISISIPEWDLKKIKDRAIESGIPYQTLISAVLHQYAEGKISAAI